MCWFYQKLIPLMPFIVFLLYFYLLLGSKYICIYLFPFPARQSSCDVLLGKFVRKYFLDLCRPRPFFAFNLYYCRNIDSLRKAIRWFQELFLNAFFYVRSFYYGNLNMWRHMKFIYFMNIRLKTITIWNKNWFHTHWRCPREEFLNFSSVGQFPF